MTTYANLSVCTKMDCVFVLWMAPKKCRKAQPVQSQSHMTHIFLSSHDVLDTWLKYAGYSKAVLICVHE